LTISKFAKYLCDDGEITGTDKIFRLIIPKQTEKQSQQFQLEYNETT
jgi:hypothetical protein